MLNRLRPLREAKRARAYQWVGASLNYRRGLPEAPPEEEFEDDSDAQEDSEANVDEVPTRASEGGAGKGG